MLIAFSFRLFEIFVVVKQDFWEILNTLEKRSSEFAGLHGNYAHLKKKFEMTPLPLGIVLDELSERDNIQYIKISSCYFQRRYVNMKP